ncbi:MAG: tripartite tricarboxylate transporter substrate binding protein [Oscillospiraceae bacterium]
MKHKMTRLLVMCLTLSMILGCSGKGSVSSDATAAGSGGAVPNTTHADFPSKPIEIIVPFAAGGQSDTAVRLLLKTLPKYLPNHATVVVLNKPGAGSQLGVQELIKAKPDGHTLGVISGTNVTTFPLLQNVKCEISDITPICQFMDNSQMIAVPLNAPYKTPQELMAFWKSKPSKPFSMGIMAAGSSQELLVDELAAATGCPMTAVPFASSNDALTAMYQGTVDAVVMWPLNYDKSQSQIMMTATLERVPIFPEVPTVMELGVDFAIRYMHFDIAAPAGLPDDLTKILVEAFKKAIEDPETIAAYEAIPLNLQYKSPDECLALYEGELKDMTVYLKAKGILK